MHSSGKTWRSCSIVPPRSKAHATKSTKSTILAALGAVAGLFFALWGTRVLVAMRPFGRALQIDTPLDWRVLGFPSRSRS